MMRTIVGLALCPMILGACGAQGTNASGGGESGTTATSGAGATTTGGGTTTTSSSTGGVGSANSPGTADTLNFAMLGDTRPSIQDDTAGYPTPILTKIWKDVAAANPSFVIDTGDFQSASATGGQTAPQLTAFIAAKDAVYKGKPFYPCMGNHECADSGSSPETANCGAGNVDGTPANYTDFMSMMVAPTGATTPYYAFTTASTLAGGTGSWTAKFLVVAANAWSDAQGAWLEAEMQKPTTYTFIVRHEGTAVTDTPGVPPSAAIMAKYPYTLLLAGHTHTFSWTPTTREVINGIGGAPLEGTYDYGYVLANQRADGAIVFTVHDYETTDVVSTFTVNAEGAVVQ